MEPLDHDVEVTAGRVAGDAEPSLGAGARPSVAPRQEGLAEALWRARGTAEMAEIAADEIRSAFDAALVLVTIADEAAGGLVSIAASGRRNRDIGVEPLLPFDTPTLMTDAFRSEGPLVIDVDTYVARYPHMAKSIPDSGIVMAVGHRFVGPDAAGAISMSFADRRTFTAADGALLERMLSVLPAAFARAQDLDRERMASLTLQEALLPKDRLLGHAGWQRAVRYQPASDDDRIGGDWFDLFEAGPDRLAVAVGDIVGRGMTAAAVMGQMRSALRALAPGVEHPKDALDQLDRFSRDVEGAFASTALLAFIDSTSRQVRIATAGHLPPVVVSDSGTMLLDIARGTPLGVDGGRARQEQVIALDDEQTILFYTDGLVERRGEIIDDGLDRLASALADLRDEPLQLLVDRIIAEVASGDDDLALVALRPVGPHPRTFSASIRSRPIEIRALRHELRPWLASVCPDAAQVDDLLVAVSEAMTNARDHGYQGGDDGEIVVNGRVREDRVEVRVRDRGRWAPSVRSPIRGRGLEIIAAIADTYEIDPTTGGTEVRIVVQRR